MIVNHTQPAGADDADRQINLAASTDHPDLSVVSGHQGKTWRRSVAQSSGSRTLARFPFALPLSRQRSISIVNDQILTQHIPEPTAQKLDSGGKKLSHLPTLSANLQTCWGWGGCVEPASGIEPPTC
jgi:hypothetical protein